jgi:negative regulator of sigma-B (phosphoserine phosphatase)
LNVAGHVVQLGVAQAPFPHERESGDRYVVQPCGDGLLLAAVDGTGHGTEAAIAATIAAATLRSFAHESPIALVLRCHEELKGTRGAVMTVVLLHLSNRTLTWLGVGNVEAVVCHAIGGKVDRALLRAGVIGYQLPVLRSEMLPLNLHDTVILATDGVKPGFEETLDLTGDPQSIADDILARYGGGVDDALVLVARYLGRDATESPATA